MMTPQSLEIKYLFGDNSLVVIVFQTYDHLVAGIFICRKVHHELSLKIETGPLFQLEIYIIFYINSHHDDDNNTPRKIAEYNSPNLRSTYKPPAPGPVVPVQGSRVSAQSGRREMGKRMRTGIISIPTTEGHREQQKCSVYSRPQ